MKNSKNVYTVYTSIKNKGITLVSLIITIIILLILAGISISVLTQNGLFEKAKDAEERTEQKTAEENAILTEYESKINEYSKENEDLKENEDSKENEDETNVKYLYNSGNEYETITGGWRLKYCVGDNAGFGSATKEESYIDLKTWGIWCSYIAYTVNPIDLTNFKKIYIEISDISLVETGYAKIWITYGKENANENGEFINSDIQSATSGIYSIDITNINGLYKIGVIADNGGNAKVNKVWLEK